MPLAINRCPGCGLRFGQRKEEVGRPYRCRRCKRVVVHSARLADGDSVFNVRYGDPGDPNLMEIPKH